MLAAGAEEVTHPPRSLEGQPGGAGTVAASGHEGLAWPRDQPRFSPTAETPFLTAGPRWRGEPWGAADSFARSRGRSGGDEAPLQPRCPCGSGERGPDGQSQPRRAAALPGCRRARSPARRAEPPSRRVAQARMP